MSWRVGSDAGRGGASEFVRASVPGWLGVAGRARNANPNEISTKFDLGILLYVDLLLHQRSLLAIRVRQSHRGL